MRKSANLFFILLFLSLSFPAAFAADQNAGPDATGGMDPAIMEKMKALVTPNEKHKLLENFVGKWTYSGQFWMSPEAPAQEMKGTAENSMIFGGRFLKQEIEGPWMGETFHGLGYTGYDNIRGEYESVWLDSMSTSLMTSSGQYDAASKTLGQGGTISCPLTGEKNRKSRSEWKTLDADHTLYTSYMNDPATGKEFKSMEITYARA